MKIIGQVFKDNTILRIAFYISTHGFGHAARQQAIIQELAQRGVQVYVRTGTPPKFYTAAYHYHQERYDIGVIMPGVMQVDAAATFAWYSDFLQRQPEIVEREAAFIREHNIQLVAVDMPPIGCEIAARANVPSVVLTHFTWDWVYEHYLPDFPQYQFIVDSLKASYAKASLLLEMPFAHEMSVFPHIEKIPLVINPVTKTRAEICADFAIPANHNIALPGMGGQGWGSGDVSALRDFKAWTFLLTPDAYDQVRAIPHCRCVPMDYPGYHNLIAAADVVIGKAGWSTVAEAIGHRTPMLYTLNDNWRENALLEAALQDYGSSLYIPKTDFENGAWLDVLDNVAHRPHSWRDITTNGAAVAAEKLIQHVLKADA
jgi:L-arabinokinase